MYIGYTKLEHFLTKLEPAHALHLCLLKDQIVGSEGVDLIRVFIWAQASIWDGRQDQIHYWRMLVGEVLAPGGIPWERQFAQLQKAAVTALESVKQFLERQPNVAHLEQGSIIAMPRELKLVNGQTDCLVFDKETSTFSLVEAAPQPAATSATAD